MDSTLESQPWRRPPVYAVALFVPRNEIPLDCNVTPRAYQAARRRPRSARHDGNDYLVVNPSRSACLRWRLTKRCLRVAGHDAARMITAATDKVRLHFLPPCGRPAHHFRRVRLA